MAEENGEVKAGEAPTGAVDDATAAAAVVAQGSTALASPILVFLNSASGGKMGPKVMEKIRVLIPESQ